MSYGSSGTTERGRRRGPFLFAGTKGYIALMVSRDQRIILADHARLPWRFFGRLTAVQAGL